MIPLWVFGGGGHAKSVIDAARSTGSWDVVGVLDDQALPKGQDVSGVPIRGNITRESVTVNDIENAVIAIGDNATRLEIAHRVAGAVQWATIIHSASYVAPDVELGEGTVVLAGAVIQPACKVGRHVIANTSCSIGHDCVVEDFVHVAPGTNLAGGARIRCGAFLGIGSRVIPLREVGAWSTIGAGGVVVHDIPEKVTAVGVPASVIESKTDNLDIEEST